MTLVYTVAIQNMAFSGTRLATSKTKDVELEGRAFRRALALLKEAAERIPAYRAFLRKAKIKAESVRTPADFAQVPCTDKQNYISKHSIDELSWDGKLSLTRYISSSSGSTGVPFYWPRGRKQDFVVGAMFRRIYEQVFKSRTGSTLAVNSFALGAWIAGLEFFNAAKWSADTGSNIVLVTPGIDKSIAVDEIKRLAPSFDRVVIGGYPPFVKDILEHGAIEGINWSKHDVRLFTGGEAFSEKWRDKVIEILGKKDALTTAINIYGMAETGVVGFESPLSIYLRRNAEKIPSLKELLTSGSGACALYQYDPMVRYFEQVGDGGLVLTTEAGFPLIRYDTRDSGGIFGYESMLRMMDAAGRKTLYKYVRSKDWKFPFVYLRGRRDLSISLYALNIYVENVKFALESSKFAAHLSGLFTMNVQDTATLDQEFAITIELSRGTDPSATLSESLTRDVTESLCAQNTEYAKLFSVIGERAKPHITLVSNGEIQTLPGRKHKWVKR